MTRRDVAIAVAVFVVITGLGLVLRGTVGGVDLPDAPHGVLVEAEVRPDGTATVTVAPGSGTREQVRDVAERIAEALFRADVVKTRVRSDGGRPYAVMRTARVFVPGGDPVVEFRAAAAESVASAAMRWTRFELRLRVPETHDVRLAAGAPPSRRESVGRWVWEPGDTAWSGTVTLHPAPALGWLALAMLLAGGTAAFLGISLWPHRRARGRRLCGAVALVVVLVVPFLRAWPYGELGVAGHASGPPLRVLAFLPLVWLATLPWGPWLLLTPRRRATMRA
ncbi:MAG TPA: hypothetical protein VGX28_10200 [Frankiaceae bacterium]|nr:hypothetical protein [Frankiaceae bacterium]